MRRKAWLFVVAMVTIGVIGCGSASEEPVATPAAPVDAGGVSPEDQAAMAALPAGPVMQNPVDAVNHYLANMKKGDDAAAELMLTRRGRLEMSRGNYVVQPLSSPTAQVDVGRTEVDPETPTGAYVSSTWSDPVEGEVSPTYELVWILRSEATEGWRIVGMATRIFEDQMPLILNFEEPALTHQRVQQAQQEMVARQQAAAAQQQANPNGTGGAPVANLPNGNGGAAPANGGQLPADGNVLRAADQGFAPPVTGQAPR